MENEKNPWIIIAWGVAIGIGGLGIGLGLKIAITGIGLAGSILSGGLAGLTLQAWIVPVTSVGIAIGGGATGVILLTKVVKEAKNNPYAYMLPVLALISGLVIDTCKELFSEDGIMRIVYGGMVTSMFLAGGLLWRQKKYNLKQIGSKGLAIILFLIPPFLIYLRYAQTTLHTGFFDAYKDIPFNILFPIILLLIMLISVTILSWIFKDGEND